MAASTTTQAAPADLKDSMGKPIVLTDLNKVKSLTREQLEAMVKKMDQTDLKKVISIVEKIDDDSIGPMAFSIFDFIGFDPFAIIAVIKIVCDHYNDPEEVMLSDIKFGIAACLYMGNIQQKALTKRGAEGRAKIEYLGQKYDMSMGTTLSGMSAETVTFPRITASFPVLAIKMAERVSPKCVNLEFLSGSIPGFMRLSPFGSLCSPNMKSEIRIFLMEACNAHGADMAIAYEKGRLKKAKKEIKYDTVQLCADQWSFIEIASSSPVPSEESKKSLLTKLNIIKYFDDLEKVVKNYRAIMSKRKIEDVELPSRKTLEDQLTEYLVS
jgi:hypothetical protein